MKLNLTLCVLSKHVKFSNLFSSQVDLQAFIYFDLEIIMTLSLRETKQGGEEL